MSARFRLLFFVGCALVLAMHAPRCFEALRGPVVLEQQPESLAILEPELGP